jgi:hypothetical protein
MSHGALDQNTMLTIAVLVIASLIATVVGVIKLAQRSRQVPPL